MITHNILKIKTDNTEQAKLFIDFFLSEGEEVFNRYLLKNNKKPLRVINNSIKELYITIGE